MGERKETRQYTLTVEGETEKMYFEWLQKEINTSENAKYKVKINVSIQQFPLSYIKNSIPSRHLLLFMFAMLRVTVQKIQKSFKVCFHS